MDFLAAITEHVDYWLCLFVIGLVLGIGVLRQLQNSRQELDLADLIIGPDGKISLSKVGQLGAFIVSSWAFVWLTANDKLGEWYFVGYMAAWCGVNIAAKMVDRRSTETAKITVSTDGTPASIQVGEQK